MQKNYEELKEEVDKLSNTLGNNYQFIGKIIKTISHEQDISELPDMTTLTRSLYEACKKELDFADKVVFKTFEKK